MKEMHERVAELEQRLARMEAIVGDPDAVTSGMVARQAQAYYDDLTTSGRLGLLGDEPRVVSGGTEIRGYTWKPPVDNEWEQPVSFSS